VLRQPWLPLSSPLAIVSHEFMPESCEHLVTEPPSEDGDAWVNTATQPPCDLTQGGYTNVGSSPRLDALAWSEGYCLWRGWFFYPPVCTWSGLGEDRYIYKIRMSYDRYTPGSDPVLNTSLGNIISRAALLQVMDSHNRHNWTQNIFLQFIARYVIRSQAEFRGM
jgi:hypothetical protein